MKKLLCLMIFASLFTVSAEAAPEKSAAPKAAAKAAVKKKAAPAKAVSAPAEAVRSNYPTGYKSESRTPRFGWSQESTVK